MADLPTTVLRCRSSKLAEDLTDREQSTETPRRRVYADDLAADVMHGAPIDALVAHYRRDNPFPASLRQHASFHAAVARSTLTTGGKPWPHDVRRRSAVCARAMLLAAQQCDTPNATRLP